MTLLKEINDLRTELKRSRTQAHDLEATLKIAKKQGFSEVTGKVSSATNSMGLFGRSNMSALSQMARVVPHDESRIIEMQKIEIGRLRTKIRELDSAERRSSGGVSGGGGRLPPMHPTVSVQ